MENQLKQYRDYLETIISEYSAKMPKGNGLQAMADRFKILSEFIKDYTQKSEDKGNELLEQIKGSVEIAEKFRNEMVEGYNRFMKSHFNTTKD